jgi:rhodanese-related sulfurtransferase/DNA-binding HxlR family transcriptional regulator
MSDRGAKDALFDAFASVARALASGRRAEIVEVLAQGERSVEEVAEAIEQSVANTSHHLRTLAAAGLVRTRREGTRVIYSLTGERVEEMWAAIRAVAAEYGGELERLARDYLGDRDGMEAVSREDLARRFRRGEVTVVDVRPTAEYAAGHIPGARSVPPEEMHQRLKSIDRHTEVVAYCRGPYCVFADEAVRHLRARGRRARRLEDGFPEWRRAGLPVEVGPSTW